MIIFNLNITSVAKCHFNSNTFPIHSGTFFELDTEGELPSLKFSVYHKGGFSVSETGLGEVRISLSDIDPDGEPTELWYPLKAFGRMKNVSGELHLRLTFNRPVKSNNIEDDEEDDDEDDENGDGSKSVADSIFREPDELEEDLSPNELVVNVIQARNLERLNSTVFGDGSSDPFVRLRVDGFPDKATGYIKGNVAPVWNERIFFSGLKKDSLSVQVTVFDHNSVQLKRFMGRVFIPLYEFHDKKPRKKWYKLFARYGNDGKDRGEIELTILWRYSPAQADIEFKQQEKDKKSVVKGIGRGLGKAANYITGEVDDDDMDVADEDDSGEVNDAELPGNINICYMLSY